MSNRGVIRSVPTFDGPAEPKVELVVAILELHVVLEDARRTWAVVLVSGRPSDGWISALEYERVAACGRPGAPRYVPANWKSYGSGYATWNLYWVCPSHGM